MSYYFDVACYNMLMTNTESKAIIASAALFATKAHARIGQVRKYTGDPYIVHPAAVAELVTSVDHTPEMVAAAWLHDTVEDTDVTINDIEMTFGPKIALLVSELTDVSVKADGNRAVRKLKDRMHTATVSPEAKTVKLADLIDNSKSIIQYDLGFARTYIAEKSELLKVLKEGDSTLWARAKQIVEKYKLEIGNV